MGEIDTATYRWKLQDASLVSVGQNDNPLTILAGSIVNGNFSSARYKLTTPLNLLHTKNWALEWRMNGPSGLTKIWDEAGTKAAYGPRSIATRSASASVAFAEYVNRDGDNQTVHHGVRLGDYGISYTEEHLYRIQNIVASDGTNVIWLYVDGVKVAPMSDAFSAGTNFGQESLAFAQDYSFGYMGTTDYPLKGFTMTDIAFWEDLPIDTATYRWKIENNALVSIGGNDNTVTTIEGGIVDGVFDNAIYQLTTPISLAHDKDWAVEWRSSIPLTGMAKIFAEYGTTNPKNSVAICYRVASTSIGFTRYESKHYHYAVKLNQHGIDIAVAHTYRLQNKVNEDGTNTVWLYVDGAKIAPTNEYFDSTKDYGEYNWVSGKDFGFGYMGGAGYTLRDGIIDDISVWESGASDVFPETPPYDERSFQIGLIMGLLSNGNPSVTPAETFDADSFNKGYEAGRSLRKTKGG